jgi:hypothetical protein
VPGTWEASEIIGDDAWRASCSLWGGLPKVGSRSKHKPQEARTKGHPLIPFPTLTSAEKTDRADRIAVILASFAALAVLAAGLLL